MQALPLHGIGVDRVVRGIFGSQGINRGQCGRRLAHVELAGDDIGDQAGAVFAEEVDFSLRMGNGTTESFRRTLDFINKEILFIAGWECQKVVANRRYINVWCGSTHNVLAGLCIDLLAVQEPHDKRRVMFGSDTKHHHAL